MTMDPTTGQGFDAIQISEESYFDPNATDERWPGALGLQVTKKTFWQGDVEFPTFEVTGPVMGLPYPDGTLIVSSGAATADQNISNNTSVGGTDNPAGSMPPTRNSTTILNVFPSTPCLEEDGSPTDGEANLQTFLDITLLGAYGGDIKFPVLPEEFGANFSHEYWTPRVVGLGEIVMPGGQSMETISWDCFFPTRYDSQYVIVSPLDLEKPDSLAARLIWTMRYKMACQLVVGGGLWNERVVITSFNYKHKWGEIGDIYYSISFKRYRAPIVTTSPNPDTIKDRWYKDPRTPGANVPPGTPISEQGRDKWASDGTNNQQVPIFTDPYTPVPFDEGPSVSPGREALISLEYGAPDGVVRAYNVAGMYAYQQQQMEEPQIAPKPGGPEQLPGETFEMVARRLSKVGPNDVQNLLSVNKWVTDNGYDPYTSHLPIGSGVKYFKETPVGVPKPIAMTVPNIGAPVQDPVTGQIRWPRGTQAAFPGTPGTTTGGGLYPPAGVPANKPQEVEIAPANP